ncbi:MAG: dUTP diphosphatase [Oscillospiraceae bacterium]|jgi:dUTP pyrophosphatase|nr:dUTP diphosphatase [Oscillospiraceae bacterium]
MNELRIKLLRESSKPPSRATPGSAGFDLFADLPVDVVIEPGETKLIPCGFSMALEPGFAAFLYARSSLGIRFGIIPANCVGVIDSDYRGEIGAGLRNTSEMPYLVKPGSRIAQMVIASCETPKLVLCPELDETERGSGGFGSSGE